MVAVTQVQCPERGQAAWEQYRATGESVSADELVAEPQSKVDALRTAMQHQLAVRHQREEDGH